MFEDFDRHSMFIVSFPNYARNPSLLYRQGKNIPGGSSKENSRLQLDRFQWVEVHRLEVFVPCLSPSSPTSPTIGTWSGQTTHDRYTDPGLTPLMLLLPTSQVRSTSNVRPPSGYSSSMTGSYKQVYDHSRPSFVVQSLTTLFLRENLLHQRLSERFLHRTLVSGPTSFFLDVPYPLLVRSFSLLVHVTGTPSLKPLRSLVVLPVIRIFPLSFLFFSTQHNGPSPV